MKVSHLKNFFSDPSSLVVGLIFAINSFLFGNWVTRIPDIKLQSGLSEAELGLALAGAPVGALLIMPVCGWLISKLHLGRAIVISTFVHTASAVFIGSSTSLASLAAALGFFGLTSAFMDISMNTAAAATEKSTGRYIMSSCHGMWSLGAMLGAGTGSLAVGAGVGADDHLNLLVTLLIIVTVAMTPRMLLYQEETSKDDKVFALPSRALAGLAIMAFCVMLGEGGIADWSAIYMKSTLMSNPYITGLAYAAFSMLMSMGRFSGDAIIPQLGPSRVVRYGGLLGLVGLGSTLLVAHPGFAILGFAMTGLGFSCIIPVLFSAAARQKGLTPGSGIAAVTTIGYAGFLAGPPVIGFLAEISNLSVALGLIVLLSGIIGVMSLLVNFK